MPSFASIEGNFSMRCPKFSKSPTVMCYRLIDENKHYMFFAIIIFAVFILMSRNAEVFIQSLEYMESLSLASQVLMFILLFIFVSQPISWGYIILNISAGFLYGFFGGVVIVCMSSSIGITIVHLANRFCFKQCLSKMISKLPQRITPMMDLLKGKHAFKLVLLSRLTPLPFGLMNAFFGVSGVGTVTYIVASVLGLLPTQAINAYIGTTLRSIEEVTSNRHKSYYVILIFQIVACCFVSSLVVRLANQNLDNELLQQVTISSNGQNGTISSSNNSSSSNAGSSDAAMNRIQLSNDDRRDSFDDDNEQELDDTLETTSLIVTKSQPKVMVTLSPRSSATPLAAAPSISTQSATFNSIY